MPILLPSPTQPAPSLSDPATFGARSDADLAHREALVSTWNSNPPLIAGDFGIGRRAAWPNASLNAPGPQGFYYCIGIADTPTGGNGVLENHAISSEANAADVFQIFHATTGADAGASYTRYILAGSIRPWRVKYDNRNVVGNVSYSSGVLSGAIIENGSNSNGSFVKFADGTMECRHVSPTRTTTNAVGSRFVDAAAWDWAFPAAFVSEPVVGGTAQRQSGAHNHSVTIGSGGFSRFGASFFLNAGSADSAGVIHAIAKGKWSA